VGLGSSLTKDAIENDDYTIVKDRAQEFINKYNEIKDKIENSKNLF
jgi:2-keto-3-deoxy-6-phosphogluconate aldolase